MSIKINAQTVVFKGQSFVKNQMQDDCEYCHAPFKSLAVEKQTKEVSVKTEVLIKIDSESMNYCPECGRKLK